MLAESFSVPELISVLGAILILIAFVGINSGMLKHPYITFNLLNLLGSLLVGYSSIVIWNPGSLLLNIFFVVAATVFLIVGLKSVPKLEEQSDRRR